MRERLSSIIEKLQVSLLKREGSIPKEVRDLMLQMVTDAFKSGYAFGVTDSKGSAQDAIDDLKNNICIMGKILGDDKLVNSPIVEGAWTACDTLKPKITEYLNKLKEDKLH